MMSLLPPFAGMSPELHLELARRATLQSMVQGTQVFAPGGSAGALLIMVAGTLRVEQLPATGQDTLLYRVNGVGTGAVAVAEGCLLLHHEVALTGVIGMAETDLDLLSLPSSAFDDLMASSAEFRSLVYRTYAMRIRHLSANANPTQQRTGLRATGRRAEDTLTDVRRTQRMPGQHRRRTNRNPRPRVT